MVLLNNLNKKFCEVRLNGCKNVIKEYLEKTASVAISLRNLAEKYAIDAFAVKCFPEFIDEFKMVPCAAIGRTTDKGIMTACEEDMIGALTMLIEHYLTGNPVFFVDLISMDEKTNIGVVWHCGNAPIAMAENPEEIRYGYHSILSQESQYGFNKRVCM